MQPNPKKPHKPTDPKLTAQIHVIAGRGPSIEYVQRMIKAAPDLPAGSSLIEASSKAKWIAELGLPNVRRVPGPWRYHLYQGHVSIGYPEGWELSEFMFGQLCDDAGSPSKFNTVKFHHYNASKNHAAHDVPRDKVLMVARTRVLTITSKMGAMSFNLPAGPPHLGGSCPGALPGWRTDDLPVNHTVSSKDKERAELIHPDLTRTWSKVEYRSYAQQRSNEASFKQGRRLVRRGMRKRELSIAQGGAAQRKAGQSLLRMQIEQAGLELAKVYHLAQLEIDANKPAGFAKQPDGRYGLVVNPRTYICNGCYAMKGSYGNFSVIFGQTVRMEWLKWCLANDPQEFVDVMTLAIEAARQKNAKKRERDRGVRPIASDIENEKMLATPDPKYFRIHDCGDFFKVQYFILWCQVMDRFADVNFWAPTRLWFDPNIARELQRRAAAVRPGGGKGWPKNLNMRPSALHFGDPAPSLPNLCMQKAGSGSMQPAKFGNAPCFDAANGGVGEWMCPAYRPYTMGGGALHPVKGKGAGKFRVWGTDFESSGSCQYAQGMPPGAKCGTLQATGKRVQGCRVCWVRPDVHVVYAEH